MKLSAEQIAELKREGGVLSGLDVFSGQTILDLINDLEEVQSKIVQLEIAAVNRSVSNKEASALYELADVRAKLAAAEKAAGRYQYLREIGVMLDGHDFLSAGSIADYRIDAAIAAQEGK